MNFEEFLINYGYLSSDESEESDNNLPASRHSRPRQNPFRYNDKKFKANYRVTKSLAKEIIDLLRPFLSQGSRSSDLSVETKVLTALNFFAKGCYQSNIGTHESAAIAQGTVSCCLAEVVDALNHPSIFEQWVKFPRNINEMTEISQRFYQKYGLPGVVGCIDCTHVAIHPPPNNEQYEEAIYVNRKNYHSINTQLICDDNLRILNVNALFPGGTHDSFVWNQSKVKPLMERLHEQQLSRFYLIGDSGYGLRPWLHTPILEPQTRHEQAYNKSFKTARATIERCNGVLKTRFRCLLKHRVLHYLPEKATKIINSCCVLHNMCIYNNIEIERIEDDDDEDLDPDQIDFGMVGFEWPVGQETRSRELAAGEAYRNYIGRNYF